MDVVARGLWLISCKGGLASLATRHLVSCARARSSPAGSMPNEEHAGEQISRKICRGTHDTQSDS